MNARRSACGRSYRSHAELPIDFYLRRYRLWAYLWRKSVILREG